MYNNLYDSTKLYANTLSGQYSHIEHPESRSRVITEKKGLFARLKGLFTKKEKKD